ncbi:MAG: T9SS type A sorting domain-containing protein [Flavobacteriaceae bacterium]|nr:T9SS type A sorting domain-containing protein [Flavobacteriaceae bacterium]
MKPILLLLVFFSFELQAQTTYNLDWEMGIGTNINLTINIGDTVIWTWTDEFPHTVQSNVGSTETFNSGTKTGIGSSYQHIFNMVGTNPYRCGFHPLTMAGTITVLNPLEIEDFALKSFSILPNPAYTQLFLKLPDKINVKSISIFDLLGQLVYSGKNMDNSINISNLNSGIYFLKISSQNVSHTKQFVKL